ncbi:MAG: DUF6282 family protein [Sphingomonas sp.]
MTDPRIEALLVGAIDLHCHSGPSVMPRMLNHVEAIRQAEEAGLRAILFKDHYYSVTPVVALLKETMAPRVELLSGVPLNNTTGGLNAYAVEHGFQLGANIVWMPTFSAANHIRHSYRRQYLPTKQKMMTPEALTVLDPYGKLVDAVLPILDHIAAYDGILSGGHLHVSEIFPLFEEAQRRGVTRLLVNHPNFLIDAKPSDMTELAGMGAYLEHSCCMWAGVQGKNYTADGLDQLIKAGGIDNTIIGSDLGQVGNPSPVDGFRHVIGMCIGLGYSDDDIRKMIGGNAARLVGLDAKVGQEFASAAE